MPMNRGDMNAQVSKPKMAKRPKGVSMAQTKGYMTGGPVKGCGKKGK